MPNLVQEKSKRRVESERIIPQFFARKRKTCVVSVDILTDNAHIRHLGSWVTLATPRRPRNISIPGFKGGSRNSCMELSLFVTRCRPFDSDGNVRSNLRPMAVDSKREA
jgi:hypothetical protein